MIPLAEGWYAVVRILELPITLVKDSNKADSNCDPLSVVMVCGEPNLATQVFQKASITSVVDVVFRGTASGHRENLSIMVKQ